MTTLPTNRTQDDSAVEHLSDHNILAGFNNAHSADPAAHSGTYVPSDPTLAITYNGDGTIASVAETQGGTTITTTFTYNGDGTIATSTRLGVTRTYTYASGNLTAVA